MMKKLIFLLFCSTCFGYVGPLSSFNAGQVSPLIEARANFEKYNSSCRTLENILVTAQGPAQKRPGTKYIATAKTGQVRLIPFEYSTDDAYILEFGDNYMRFYRDDAQILDGGSPLEITTVYAAADLDNVQFVQTNNEMYLVDGSNIPQKLIRTSHVDWGITDAVFVNGPFLPENESAITITPSGIANNITLTASSGIFETGAGSTHNNSIWAIEQVRESSTITGSFTSATGTSISSPFFTGNYSFTTSGAGTGTTTLQRSTNAGISWRNALVPLTDQLFDNPSEFEEDGAIYRIVRSGSGTGTIDYSFTIADNINKGVVRITSVTSSTVALALVLNDLVDTSATTLWREGYWSDFRGWPQTVASYQQRLVYGGSETEPQTIWFGEQNPDDPTNFLEGTLDTDAFTIALDGQNPLKWMLAQDFLLIGTSGSCGKYGEQGKAVTPTSPSYQEQTRNGAAAIRAVFGGDDVLFVERGGRKVRQYGFDLQTDKYLTPDLNVLSPEITESGITEIAFQSRPDPMLWCVLANGDMATLTYNPAQAVIAWTKQITDGDFESVAVISSGDAEDEVWVSVKRTIGGSAVRYIEQFQPRDWGSDDDEVYFVDSGLTANYTGDIPAGATDTYSGIDHLEGETVKVWADGVVLSDEVVVNGGITIDVVSTTVATGLPYTAKIETLPIRVDPQDISLNKKIKRLWVDLYQSGTFGFAPDSNGEVTTVNMWEEATLTAKQGLYTSTMKMKQFPFIYAGYQKQTVYLESSEPVPLTVRSIVAEIEGSQ